MGILSNRYNKHDISTILNILNTFSVSGKENLQKLLYIIQVLENPVNGDEEEEDGKRN